MEKLCHYEIKRKDSPYWAFAIHDGHEIHPQLLPYLLLSDSARLREEDPFTAMMLDLPCNTFFMKTSRFQLDINRNQDRAVYLRPEHAWGLSVWDPILPAALLNDLYADHQSIFLLIENAIEETISKFGYFILLDIHSYNAKRLGPEQEVQFETDPLINLGTVHLKPKWKDLVKAILQSLAKEKLEGKPIDIRENIKFKGGYLSETINQLYGDFGCVLSIEFRKDFMDEWTGVPDKSSILARKELLQKTLSFLNQYFYHDGKE